ncbi:lysine (K)-specific demethylase 2Aa [Chanos chanos]|uniref:[histone H3]-dimethyl-L-lysine(36) demethylase n=1 Tax=Chanos chanos TaxID=29144 RepID=A0A6J2WJW8_CHACN|nr:lysine-specific demethylase 2A-like [Chanos chanos]
MDSGTEMLTPGEDGGMWKERKKQRRKHKAKRGGMLTLKRSGTRRRYQDDDISDDEIEGKRTFDLEEKLHSNRFSSDRVKRMEGKDFTYEYIQRGGLRDPLIFERPDGLGIKMPDPDFSVNDVKTFVGSRRVIDVMDVTTQKGIEMSMAQWRRYYETPPSQREKLYNVISLEFSHTKLENLVKRPASVDMIDWVDNMWPRHLKERQRDSTNAIIDMQYPKVQKYCLMSVQGCYTDFHIDFGGTSVWYHILRGGKVFWLIPPTPQNLELYENWVLSGKQGDIFLGDKAMDCQRIELKQGYTFIIPSGWIHAVYTPVDTLVFGGNFLHSFNIPMQLNIYSIEDRTRVPAKFRYPFYYEMCWYVLERYLYSLTNTSYLTPEFQKYSLGIGLKRDTSSEVLNGHTKEEEKEEDDPPSPPPCPGGKVHLTPFELEGLWSLLGKLESLPTHKKCVPTGIHNAAALLHDIRALLKEHANDSPKLSYTGKPIVKWPKRPSWYQPPPPPPPVGRPKLCSTVVSARPTKPASSMSVLRRRRVRCKRCEACLRTECGDCNFCRDMKKFGGPGKLKQTCVLRQCLAPGLPLSAVCEVCGEGNQEAGEDPVFSLTLMECSNCAQIAHPGCLKVPGEGVVNKDLPSCWECPKCVQGKDTDSESWGSGDDMAVCGGPLPPGWEGAGGMRGEGGAWHGVGRPPSSLSQGSLRKRAAAPEQRLRKRMKLEGGKIHKRKSSSLDPRVAKIYRRHGMEREEEDSCSDEDEDGDGSQQGRRKMSLHVRGGASSSRRGYGSGRRGVWRGSSHRGGRGGSGLTTNPALKMRRGLGARGERGGRVRLRGGSRMQRRRYEDDDDDDDDDEDDEDDYEDEDEEEDEDESDEERRTGRMEKEHRHRRRRRRTDEDEDDEDEDDEDDEDDDSEERDLDAEDEDMEDLDDGGEDEEDDEEGENQTDSEPDPPVLLVSDLNDDLLNGSYLTVTLQRPPKAKRDPGSIVPKLEAAMSPRTPGAPGYVQRKTLHKTRHKNGGMVAAGNGLSQTKGPGGAGRHHRHRNSGGMMSSKLDGERDTASPSSSSSSRSSVSPTPPPPITSSSPPSLLSHPSFKDVGNEPGCEKEVWMSVFRYLNRTDLAVCMRVCKAWYKWSCDKRLWTHMDVSRCRSLSAQAMSAIIKRQPVALDLSWTPVSKKQLSWIIHHVPGLKDLILTGCSWSCVSALSTSTCPCLRTLDLCWAEGVGDRQIRDLVTPPGSDNRSRLRGMLCLRLAGLDISDSTLRLLIRHMPLLRRLDLSHCRGLTDQSVNLLTATGSPTRNTLTHVSLAGCNKLTDACLSYMKRVSGLTLLDLRGCKGVTRGACENFISDLSYCTFFCLTEEKLIQRIS